MKQAVTRASDHPPCRRDVTQRFRFNYSLRKYAGSTL